jgi:hypothetical protein
MHPTGNMHPTFQSMKIKEKNEQLYDLSFLVLKALQTPRITSEQQITSEKQITFQSLCYGTQINFFIFGLLSRHAAGNQCSRSKHPNL